MKRRYFTHEEAIDIIKKAAKELSPIHAFNYDFNYHLAIPAIRGTNLDLLEDLKNAFESLARKPSKAKLRADTDIKRCANAAKRISRSKV